MKIFIMSLVVFFTLSPSHAQADPAEPGDRHQGRARGHMADSMFKRMDANADNEISKSEFEAFHATRFKELDSNADGKLTKEEVEALHGKMKEHARSNFDERFNKADVNKDGSLSAEEAKKTPILAKYFVEIDTNKNGLITLEEVRVTMNAMHRGEKKSGEDQNHGKDKKM
ncbi:MAG: EF-hand domain-containing protein [Candidatus Nitrotoga sp.]